MAKLGTLGLYPVNWTEIASKIRERDAWACRICSADSSSKLCVHHIDYNPANNAPENLVTLCDECHRAVHAERYKPQDYDGWPIPWGEHPEIEAYEVRFVSLESLGRTERG
jgi:5-methylcytosine-specific restriction endonuclease McrA